MRVSKNDNKIPEETIDKIYQMISTGATIAHTAKELGLNPKTVVLHRKKMGLD